MKNKISHSTLLITCISTYAIAQPTFTTAHISTAGKSFTFYQVDTVNLLQGNAGANQTWNFSSFATITPATVATYKTPSNTPYSASFPTANLASETPQTGGVGPSYEYYTSTGNSFSKIGVATQLDPSDPYSIYNYSNAEQLFSLPFTYQSAFTDSYVGQTFITSGGISLNQYRQGYVSVAADAYGTLTTLAGTFTNCLRVKSVETIVDSSVYVLPLPTIVFTLHRTRYFWLKPGSLDRTFEIVFDTISSPGIPDIINKSAYYSPNVTGLSDVDFSINKLKTFPNPVKENSNVNIDVSALKQGNYSFTLFNSSGEAIKKNEFILPTANSKQQVNFHTSNLKAGIYLVKIENGYEAFTSRFVVE